MLRSRTLVNANLWFCTPWCASWGRLSPPVRPLEPHQVVLLARRLPARGPLELPELLFQKVDEDRVLLLRVRIALHHLRLCLVRRSADPTLFFGEG